MTESMRAATLIDKLHLKLPTTRKKKSCGADDASLVDSVNYKNPAMVAWQTKEGVASAIRHHFPDDEDCLNLPYEDQVTQLFKVFKLADLRSVLQGLLTDAGKDWRKLKLNKLKSMRVLGPEFVKACVELCNATAELHSPLIPANVVV